MNAKFESMTLIRAVPLILIAFWFPVAQAEISKPNIVFIIADDLGWADVAFHGGNAPTPNLDQLAKEGLELTAHYVAPVCSPTRAGFLTGRYWSRFGITTPTNEQGLPFDTVTLPKVLQSAGYKTGLFGKWHLGSKSEWGPNKFGFDHAYGSLAGGVSPWNHRYKKGPYSVTWHRNGKLIEESGHVTDLLTDEAVTWIEERDTDPFFLYIPYTAVHLPLKEPEEWLSQVPQSISGDVPRHYAASIMHLDNSVGRIVTALKDKGVREQTLFVFTSDNGGSTVQNNDLKYPDDDCPNGKLTGNNLPFRAAKGSIYEGGVRVPTVVSWPGRIKPGKQDSPVCIVDWMPTFCWLAGAKPAGDLHWDGIDLSKYFLEGVELKSRPVYIAAPHWRARSLRQGDWKLIVHGKGAKEKVEVFNLANDPSEKNDLTVTEPDRVKAMRETLQEVAAMDNSSVVQ